MINKLCNIKDCIRKQKPLIHCITNPISINQCANAILSVGAKPVMAEHPGEVCEITITADALMLNTGNITDARMESMLLAIKTAKEKNIPVLLDTVGSACSNLRREYIMNILNNYTPSVIKGNFSEIKALYDEKYFSPGVDAEATVDINHIKKISSELAKKYKAVILATGKTDVITNGERIIYAKNGIPSLSSVTGTGCMLGAICTTFMAVAEPMDAIVSACCYFGICGELSKTDNGTGSFMVNLMDKISMLGKADIQKYLNVEEY